MDLDRIADSRDTMFMDSGRLAGLSVAVAVAVAVAVELALPGGV